MVENRCKSVAGNFKCKLATGHSGSHDAECGILWEDTTKLPVNVQYFIVVGKNSRSAYLLTEYTTHDGRKFSKRDYQINEIKKESTRHDPAAGYYYK